MKKILVTLYLLFVSHAIFAEDYKWSVDASLGILNGDSTELVYNADTGHKVSQLDWSIDNVPVIQLGATFEKGNVQFSGIIHMNIQSNNDAYMVDKDWQVLGQSDYSDISKHPGTKLTKAHQIDLHGIFWTSSEKMIGLMLGYQTINYKWDAYGGSYSYWNGTDVGEFADDDLVMSYEQTFSTLYIGASNILQIHNLRLQTTVKYSPFVQADDIDHHYKTSKVYYEESSNSTYAAIEFKGNYKLTKQMNMFATLGSVFVKIVVTFK